MPDAKPPEAPPAEAGNQEGHTSAGINLLRSYQFRLVVDPTSEAHFTSCSPPGARVVPLPFREGGESKIVRFFPGPTEYREVVCKYGMTTSPLLWNWFQKSLEGAPERRNVSLIMLGAGGVGERVRWNLNDCWPCEWNAAAVDAQGREIAIETLCLVYESLTPGWDAVIPAGLRRELLLVIARWLHAWVEQLLVQDGSPGGEPEPQPQPVHPPFAFDGPPAHWVEKVRKGAPELLFGLDARYVAPHRLHPDEARQVAPPRPRTDEARKGPARAPASASQGTPAWAEPPPAPHSLGILRWSERVRRRMELEALGPRRERPAPPGAEPRTAGQPPRPGQAPVTPPSGTPRKDPSKQVELPWPEVESPAVEAPPPPQRPARPEPEQLPQLRGRAAPPPGEVVARWPDPAGTPVEPSLGTFAEERWPELPEEEPAGELEEGLARRIERRGRLAREQRGD